MAATSITPSDQKGVRYAGSFTLDLASLAANTQGTDTAAISEARVGDVVVVTPRAALTEGLAIKHAYVSADGVVTIVLHNHTGSPINEGSATFDYVGFRGGTGIAN